MPYHEEIKRFVRTTLGCECPDDVFDNIECRSSEPPPQGVDALTRINIADRLLVYVVTLPDPRTATMALSAAIRQGLRERDTAGFNRFRLACVCREPAPIAAQLEQQFSAQAQGDPKAHLHLLTRGQVPSGLL